MRPTCGRRYLCVQVVVCTSATLAEAQRVDQVCHANNIRFIWAQTSGVFARVFTDFGPDFTVIDVNGEAHSGRPMQAPVPG